MTQHVTILTLFTTHTRQTEKQTRPLLENNPTWHIFGQNKINSDMSLHSRAFLKENNEFVWLVRMRGPCIILLLRGARGYLASGVNAEFLQFLCPGIAAELRLPQRDSLPLLLLTLTPRAGGAAAVRHRSADQQRRGHRHGHGHGSSQGDRHRRHCIRAAAARSKTHRRESLLQPARSCSCSPANATLRHGSQPLRFPLRSVRAQQCCALFLRKWSALEWWPQPRWQLTPTLSWADSTPPGAVQSTSCLSHRRTSAHFLFIFVHLL